MMAVLWVKRRKKRQNSDIFKDRNTKLFRLNAQNYLCGKISNKSLFLALIELKITI